MARPLSLCIEVVNAPPSRRYVRCVALPGRRPGLRLSSQGEVVWLSETDVAGELCVSAGDRLALFRLPGAVELVVKRGEHEFLVPPGRAVTLLDRDLISIGVQLLKFHIHGATSAVHRPTPFPVTQRPLAPLERWEAALGMRKVTSSSPGRRDTRHPTAIDPPSPLKPMEVRTSGTEASTTEAEPCAQSANGLNIEAD